MTECTIFIIGSSTVISHKRQDQVSIQNESKKEKTIKLFLAYLAVFIQTVISVFGGRIRDRCLDSVTSTNYITIFLFFSSFFCFLSFSAYRKWVYEV